MRKSEFARLVAAGLIISAVPFAASAAPNSSRPSVSPSGNQTARHATPAQGKPAQRAETPAPQPAPQCEALSSDPLAPKIKEIVSSPHFSNSVARSTDLRGMQAFYAARGCAPAWLQDGQWTDNAKAAIARLKDAASEGLDASDYPVPELAAGAESNAAAKADLQLSATLITFTRHLATGRIAPSRAVNEVDYGDHTPDPADVLKTLADARDIGAAIANYDPPHAPFRALKEKLGELRNASAEPEQKRIPNGSLIHSGMQDSRIPLIRERLKANGKPGDLNYDKPLFEAVRSVQAKNGLRPTGVIDSQTIASTGRSPPTSSKRCWPTWSAGAGCRASSVRPT